VRALLAAAALALALPAGSSAVFVQFQLPSKNIGCAYSTGPTSLRCDIRSGLKPEPRRSCELDWTGIAMRPTGRPAPECAGDTALLPTARVLRYGQTWRRGGFACTSRVTGLTCRNRSGRGFFLSRTGWRIF
jgi:Family of unknown function (DUF6636)